MDHSIISKNHLFKDKNHQNQSPLLYKKNKMNAEKNYPDVKLNFILIAMIRLKVLF